MAKGNTTVVIDADVKKYISEMKRVQQSTARATRDMNKNMAKFNSKVNKHSKGINTSISSIAGNFGLAFGAAGLGMVISSSVRKLADFERQMSKVKAVSGASVIETEKLNKKFKELGGTTRFTATEAAQLGEELAKLGFSTDEIIQSSEAILQLAQAADTELSNAAEVAAKTVNQFGMSAKDTQKVVDVMAKSFSSSALDITKFSESMKFVGPVAKSVGLTLEETTSILAKLADIGIESGMAGRSLRRILLEIDPAAESASQGFKELAERGITLSDAEDEVGKNAVTALNAISGLIPQVDLFTESLNNAEGSGRRMAETIEDNLIGSWTRFESTLDSWLMKAEGLPSFLQQITDLMTLAFGGDLGDNFQSEVDKIADVSKLKVLEDWLLTQRDNTKDVSSELSIVRKRMDDLRNAAVGPQAFDGMANAAEEMAKLQVFIANQEAEAAAAAEAASKERLKIFTKEQQAIKVTQEAVEGYNSAISMSRQEIEGLLSVLERKNELMLDELEIQNMKPPTEIAEENKKAYDSVEKSADAEEKRAMMVTRAASDIGAALAMEGDDRKKALKTALAGNAAFIISELIRDAVSTAKDPITGLALGAVAAAGGAFLINKIPAFAEGGVVNRPTIGLFGEAGPEAIVPLDRMKGDLGGGGVTIVMESPVVGDADEVGERLTNILKNYNRN